MLQVLTVENIYIVMQIKTLNTDLTKYLKGRYFLNDYSDIFSKMIRNNTL